jgi:hypothetical protein
MSLATAEVSCCLKEFYEWTVDTNRYTLGRVV